MRESDAIPDAGAGPELLRRVLLGAVTALIVARPLVLGEDPGMLSPLTDAHGLVLTLLWFLTALGWAGWRVWTGDGRWGIGVLEGGVLMIPALMFLSSARVASYKHPAYLITWEWLALALAFVLVRRLVQTSGEQQRLLAALVASAVSVSAFAIYQYADEMPRMRRFLEKEAASASAEDLKLRERLDLGVYSTFAHPNSFAGYVGLLLPAGFGWAWIAGRRERRSRKSVLACVAVLLMVVALALTRSKGALLGTVLVVAIVSLIQLRTLASARRGWVIAAFLAIAGVGVVATLASSAGSNLEHKTTGALATRIEYWSATWKMLNDSGHPAFLWLGVGPGNFGRYYLRYMAVTANEEIKDPHNFALDIWTSCGVFGVAALLITLALFFKQAWPAVRAPLADEKDESAEPEPRTHWEFYLGGMVGLTLGFILWALGQPVMEFNFLVDAGMTAGIRSLLWFATFALLESIWWPGPSRLLAIVAGVVVLLLNLTVSGGISFPSVALPLWVMIALALKARETMESLGTMESREEPRSWLASIAPLPLMAAIALGYSLVCFGPVTSCTQQIRRAILFFQGYEMRLAKARTVNVVEEQQILQQTQEYLRARILKPLEQAVEDDRSDAYAALQLSEWYGKLWELRYEMQGKNDETSRRQALGQAQQATRLDPEGLDGYLALYRLNMLFTKRFDAVTTTRLHEYAAKQMRQVVERAPTRASFRYQLAEVLFLLDNVKDGRVEAEEALHLDQLATSPTRKLTDGQRAKAEKWLGRGGG